MSESKVPLLPLPAAYWIGNNTELAIHSLREWARSYGDARAAEARRLALLEAANKMEGLMHGRFIADLLRDLADERSNTEQPADRRFLGVYMSPDGPITIDRQATVDQLLDAIQALQSDLESARGRASANLDMICALGSDSGRRPNPGQ